MKDKNEDDNKKKDCSQCSETDCFVKKSKKMHTKLTKLLRDEKVSPAEGALILDDYVNDMLPMLMQKCEDDRDIIHILQMRRVLTRGRGDEDEDYGGGDDNDATNWYIM